MNSTTFGAFALSMSFVFGLLLYAVIFYCLWKFYQVLSSISDNLAGIQRAIERGEPVRPRLPE